MSEHTPVPWQYSGGSIYVAGMTPFDYKVEPIAHMDREPGNGTYGAERDANAKFIVLAVNNHDALVAALDFYANKDNHRDQETGIGMMVSEVWRDDGNLARETLAAVSAAKAGED